MSKASLPAQMRDNQADAMTGHKMRTVIPRWCVKRRSKSGDVTIAAMIPDRSRAAPIRPEVVSE